MGEVIVSSIAILVSIGTLFWTLRYQKGEKRTDLVLESYARMIANSKKLSHEDRKAFEIKRNSVERGPLVDEKMRERSDEFRHEVGIELVILEAFGNAETEAAARKLYEKHRQVRRSIWHRDCGTNEHDCEVERRRAWAEVAEWAGRPSDNIVKMMDVLRADLTSAVRKQSGIAG